MAQHPKAWYDHCNEQCSCHTYAFTYVQEGYTMYGL